MVLVPEMVPFCGSTRYVFLAIAIFLIILAAAIYVASTGRKDGTRLRGAAIASLCTGAICMAIFSLCL